MTDAVEGLDDLKRLATAYKEGSKDLRKQVTAGLRAAAKPVAVDVIREGAEKMPARGGLRERIAKARPGVVAGNLGGNPRVSISLRVKEGYRLGLIDDRGELRHPVFDRPGKLRTWVTERVPAHAFTAALDKQLPQARDRVNAAVQAALDDIARKV